MALQFRPEVAQAHRQQWLGAVQLVRPLSLNLLSLGVLAAAVMVGAYLSLGEYTRKARVAGVLVPDRGLIRLLPPQAGRVLERHVQEGQAVQAGDLMFVLQLEQPALPAGARNRVLRSLDERQRSLVDAAQQQAQLQATEGLTLERRLTQMQRELGQIDAESALHQQRLALARESLARLESLRDQQFISPAQLQAKSEELLALQAQGQALQRQRTVLEREREALEGERRGLPLRGLARQGEIERDLASLQREAAEQEPARQLAVRAPASGTVSALLADAGQSVTPASALASLLPGDARLQAHLYAPSSAVAFLKPQQEVRLRLEALPYQKFGHRFGQVLQVSRSPLSPAEMANLPLASQAGANAGSEPMFRITVALADTPALRDGPPLVAGMRLQADVLLERRRLVEWLFEPVLGLAQRL